MNFETIIYDIETHPLIVALSVFILAFVGYRLFKPANTTSSTLTTGAKTVPTTQEVYNQTFNSYPTVQPPTGHIPVDTPVPVRVPPVTTYPPPTTQHLIGNPPPVVKPPVVKPPVVKPPVVKPPTKTVQGTYIHPGVWPAQTSTLSGIASHYGKSLNAIESLNQWIYQQRHTWNLIYPTDSIRIA